VCFCDIGFDMANLRAKSIQRYEREERHTWGKYWRTATLRDMTLSRDGLSIAEVRMGLILLESPFLELSAQRSSLERKF
jgi:hypothetical protein